MRIIHKNLHIFSYTSAALLVFFMILGAIITRVEVYADATSANASVTVSSACTFSAGGGNYSDSIIGGNTKEISANTITTTCNDASGYAIYAIGYSGDSYTASTHTDMIASTSGANIKTDGTGTYNSTWQMKLTAGTNATLDNSFGSYKNIPSSFTKVAHYTATTTAGTITPTYKIYANPSQPADTYTGKVKYVLLHPNTAAPGNITITYNANGGAGSNVVVNNVANYEPYNIASNTFTAPSGYAFAGWCTTNTAGSYACAGNSYAPGDEVASLATSGGGVTLYAYWKELTMQNITLSSCAKNVGANGNPTGVGDEMTIKDIRDGNNYTVRYINGECWMTQNLRYLGDTGSAAKTMTIGNNNSNITNKSITLYSLDSSDAGNFNAYSSHCDSTNGHNYACVYDSGSTTTGVWYNYYAATGGTISGSSNGTTASSDICPAGWHLPTGPNVTSGTDFNKLIGNTKSGYQNPTTGLTAFGAVTGSNYHDGSLNEYGVGTGLWWSATAVDSSLRYYLSYHSDEGFNGYTGRNRCVGYFVRCVKSS